MLPCDQFFLPCGFSAFSPFFGVVGCRHGSPSDDVQMNGESTPLSGRFVGRALTKRSATSQLVSILQAGAAAGVGVGVGVVDDAISLCRLTDSPLVSAS
jgi:hypothetical protein